jgi:tRNA threonylcarbamoyladenosine biosynthesis protein TsaB
VISGPFPWLAIDTATDVASVAIGSVEGGVLAAQSIRGARQHAAQITLLIQQVLTQAGVPLKNVTGIVIGDGPGSFTGLRIGWAAAKGLAQDRELPVVAVPSLLGAAHAATAGQVATIAACYDALRGQVFGAAYAFPQGRVETLVAPGLFTLPEIIAATPVRPLRAVGDGAERYPQEVIQWTGHRPVALAELPPVAASLLILAAAQGFEVTPAAEPVYGRPAEAQVKWETRHGRPLPHSPR